MVAVLMCGLACGPAAAAGSADADFVAEAAAFVARATGVAVPTVDLRRASPDELSTLYAAGGGKAAADEVQALFLPRSNRILVADYLDLADPHDLSYLVHEIVHAQQFSTGRPIPVSCPGKLELEAYRVQARFLREKGLKREALLKDILGLFMGACARPLP